MPGFFISDRKLALTLREIKQKEYVRKTARLSGWEGAVCCSFLPKFRQDKAFAQLDGLFVILDGYLLNKKDLFATHKVETVEALMAKLYREAGDAFFSVFRGCFSGAVYDEEKKKWIVFTNQIGDAAVFYIAENGFFAAGTQLQYLLDVSRQEKLPLSFNESCAYQLLTYGFVATDETFAKEIKRLQGGDYLVWQDGKLSIKSYHRFEKHPERIAGMTEEQIIDALDREFKNAVRLEWEKDEEYGYRHLADLSGGLDSRMGIWVAHEEKSRKVTALTYCKKGYLDETIAKKIADYWHDEFVFMPLDDASFLYDIDDNTAMLGGLSLYSGITGGKRLLESLDLSAYGIEHTGMVGDVVIGSYFHSAEDGERKQPSGMYSRRLTDRLTDDVKHVDEKYFDHELFLIYVRGFHGMCNTHYLRRNYTEVSSPFLNVEFMQLCFDIPVARRIGHNLYKKWIIKKYPEAAKFAWETTGGKITESPTRTKLRKLVKKGPQKLLRMAGKADKINAGMNPVDYWLATNDSLRAYLDRYADEALAKYGDLYSEQLREDMKMLYKTGNAMEKSMVLTVLSATKLYMDNK